MIYLDDYHVQFLDDLRLRNSKKYAQFMKRVASAMRKRIFEEAKENAPAWFGAKFNKLHTPLNIAYNARRRTLSVWGLPPNLNAGKRWKLTETETKKRRKFFTPERVEDGSKIRNGKPFFMASKTKRTGAPDGLFLSKSSHTEIHPFDDKTFYTKEGGRKYPFDPAWYLEGGRAKYARFDLAMADEVIKMFDLYAFEVVSNCIDEELKKGGRK